MRTFKISVILIFISISSYCQSIEGTITNLEGVGLEGITVTLFNTSSSRIVSFSTSGQGGKYILKVPEGYQDIENTTVQVHALGYKKENQRLQKGMQVYNFSLVIEEISLSNVVIKANKQKVTIKNDTTSYSVSDFSRVQDRSIGDVLKRMPGIQVDRDGRIAYNGKAITKFYIDGDNLLDDKYNIGTNAIPNGIVDRVQILENHEPVKMRRQTSTNTGTAINLTLKDSNAKPINQVKLGAGLNDIYSGELTSMFFRKRFKALDQFKLNNIGTDYSDDLKNHDNISVQNKLGIISSDPLLTASTINYPSIDPSTYLYNKTGILNLNNLYKLRNEWQLKLKAVYLYDRRLQNYQNLTQTLLNKLDTIRYTETLSNVLKPRRVVVELNLNANKESYYLDNTFKFTSNTNQNNADLYVNGSPVTQFLRTKILTFSNEFMTIKKMRNSNSLEFLSYISTDKSLQTLSVNPVTLPGDFDVPTTSSMLTQDLNIPMLYTKNHVALTLPGIINQTYTLGMSAQWQELVSFLSASPQGSEQASIPSNSNNINWTRIHLFSEAAFDYKSSDGKIIINSKLPIGTLGTHYTNTPQEDVMRRSRFIFSPLLRFTFEPSPNNQFNTGYLRTIDPGSIVNFHSGYILTGYRTLQSYDQSYWRDKQTFDFNYTYRQPAQLLFWNAGASYSFRGSNQIPITELSNTFSTVSYGLSDYFKNSTMEFHSGFSKYLFSLRTTVGVNYSLQFSKINQIFNAILLPYKNQVHTVSANTDTQFSKKIFLKYSGNVLYFVNKPADKDNSASPLSTNIFTQQCEFNYLPLERLSLKVSASHFYNKNGGFSSQNNIFFNTTFQYTLKKPRIDLQFDGINLANVKNLTTTTLDANTTFTTSYPLRGFMGILTATLVW